MDQTNRDIQQSQKSIYAEQGNVYVTYAGERRIPHALTPPPFLTEIFLGRQDDLQHIHDKLFAPGSNLLLVNGEGGIGKTTIASKYYHTYQHEYIHVAWVLSEKSIANALLLLAVPLGLQFDERQDTKQRLEALLTAMMNLEKPCLLVVDNANELPDLEENYQHLRRCSNFHLLLTTRIMHFERAATCTINGLPPDDALALFENYYRTLDANEKTLFFQISEAVGGNTLVLELLAKNLALRNRLRQQYSLANLLVDLQSQGLLQLSHSQAVGTDYQSKGSMRRETPANIVSAMYDLSGLPPEESALLSVFAVLPAENIPFAMLETLLHDFPELDIHLLSLAQKGWIEYNEAATSFKCSSVVQEVVRRINTSLHEDCTMLANTLIKKLAYESTHITGSSYNDALLYARYAEAVIKIFAKKLDYSLAILSEHIGNYHRITGNLERSLFFFNYSNLISKRLFEGAFDNPEFKNNLAISCQHLGNTHSALGNLDQALTFFEQYNQLENELFAAYPQNVGFKNGLAISCQYLGNTHSALGNLNQALTFFEQYNQLENELFAAYPQNMEFKNGLAISCQYLGNTHSALGNLDQALTFFAQYNQLEKELFAAYPQNVEFKNGLAISCQYLGNTHSALGNLDQALTFFAQYNQLEKELFAAYPQNVEFKNGLAISCQYLGNTHTALGNLVLALTFFAQYNQLEKELFAAYPQNVGFKNGLAISCQHLGNTHSALGNLDQALTFFIQYHQLAKELVDASPQNVGFKNGLAISCQYLGKTHTALGNLVLALTFFAQYNQLEKELFAAYPQNVGFKNGLAISCQYLGNTHSALGNLDQALTFFIQYHQLAKELVDASPQNVGFKHGLALSYQWLGEFYEDKLEDLNQAQAYYRLSKSLLLELVSRFPGYVQFKQNLDWVTSKLPDEADE